MAHATVSKKAAAPAARRGKPNVVAEINPNSERHGKAVAIALWSKLDAINAPSNYGDPQPTAETRETLAVYLKGFGDAAPKAQRGFVNTLGEFMSFLAIGLPNAEAWAEPRHMRPALSPLEQRAHVHLWLKGGAS